MKSTKLIIFISLALFLSVPNPSPAQAVRQAKTVNPAPGITSGRSNPLIKKIDIRSHMEFLASDALQGRGSGTRFEWIAGQYLASQMMQFGVEPAGDINASGERGYIQTIDISQYTFAEPPKISYSSNGTNVVLEHGKEMIVWRLNSLSVKGEFQKINPDGKIKKGSIVFVRPDNSDGQLSRETIGQLIESGAAAVIMKETPQWRTSWDSFASRKVSFGSGTPATALIIVSNKAAVALAQVADGTPIEIGGKLGETKTRQTWNSLGMIKGSDAKLSNEVILLSAHMDHLGLREDAPGEDKIFNGADDDASGCVAVLELARVLASGKRPKRTVYFAFFGSEEAGGFGSRYFAANLPFPKDKLIANLQWEMIGRPDAKVNSDELWLTGYDRSNLGSELAKHGAKLVNDPHPEENFFQRSDNYTLARQGIIAHTVSSFGLHKDYHQASDEIKTIDFDYMTNAINSMVKPVEWLVNSDFKPIWYEGKKP